MPLDAAAPFDPFAAAGLSQGQNGTWSLPQTQPTQPVVPATPATPAATPAPASPYHTVPPEQAAGPQTNLSPEEYARFQAEAAAARQARQTAPAAGNAPAQIPVQGATGADIIFGGTGAGPAAPTAAPAATALPSNPNDPFAAAGLVQGPSGEMTLPGVAQPPAPPAPGATPSTPSAAATPQPGQVDPLTGQPTATVKNQPWYQPLMNAVQTASGLSQEAAHNLTFGLDDIVAPIPAALYRSVAQGIPFSQAYDQEVAEQRAPRHEVEATNPKLATAAALTGGVASPINQAVAPLFAAAPAATTLGAVGNTVRNMAAGAGVGAASGFGMTEGNVGQRIQGAEQGAEMGAVLPPLVTGTSKAVAGTVRAFRPNAAVPRVAGQALNEAATTPPTTTPQTAPLPGFPLDVGASYNDPGLAALVRRTNATSDAGAIAQREEQGAAVRTAASGLGRAMPTAEASAELVRGMRAANAVIRQEEERLWSNPVLSGQYLHMPALKQEVERALAGLPSRYHNVIGRIPDLRAALDDLANLPADATLADVNAIRSDLLGTARTLPHDERFGKRVAQTAADALLKAVESNPALRNNPAAWAAYKVARDFTSKKWDVLGHDVFQNMLKSNRYGNEAADDRTAASRLFGFGATGGERVAEGIHNIGDMLDDIRRQWSALMGPQPAGALGPATASAAQFELAQSARNFITNSMLDAVSSVTRDPSGAQRIMMNKLSDWIDTNRLWIDKSKIFTPDQIGLLDDIRQSALMAARTENLRGGQGSETYERLAKDARFVTLFSTPLVRWSAAGAGAAIGAMLGSLQDVGIGALLGVGAENVGHALLQRFYAVPRERARQMIEEAIRDPQIAHDLRMRATAANAGKFSEKTRQWVRALLATEPPAQAARAFGAAPQPETAQ